MFSLPASGFALSELVSELRDSVNAPARLPVFLMTTVPVACVVASPGFMPEAVRIAPGALSFDMVSAPAVKMLPAFAVEAVNVAPEATVTPTATRMVARAASRRRGLARSALRRDIEIAPGGLPDVGGGRTPTRMSVAGNRLSQRDPWLCVPASRRVCRDQQELYRPTDWLFVESLDTCMSAAGLRPVGSGNLCGPGSATGARGLPLGVLLERLGELLLAHVRAALDAGLLGVVVELLLGLVRVDAAVRALGVVAGGAAGLLGLRV